MTPPSAAGATYTYGYSPLVTGIHASRTAAREAAFFLPHLRSGLRLLDLGCGPGTITSGLAAAVAPGLAIGLDVEASVLAQAHSHAAAARLDTASFTAGSATTLPFPDASFDAVFAHTLLEHVAEPLTVLVEARRVLRPGGVIGVRDCDWGSGVFFPPEPLVDFAMSLYERVWRLNGGDPDCGRRLRGLLREAGFTAIQTSASFRWDGSQDASTSDSRSFGELLARRLSLPNFATPILEQRWADEALLAQTVAACTAWSQTPDAYASMVMVEAVGRAA